MKSFVTLQVISLSILILLASSAHAMQPAPPGPYVSIEDEFVTPRPEISPGMNMGSTSRDRAYPRPEQYNYMPRPDHHYPAARQQYMPEREQPVIPWPKAKPLSNSPYPGGYQGYPQGMPR